MFVHAGAAVDDGRLHVLCQQVRCAAHRVADDDDVILHRVEGAPGVDERFPLLHRAGGGGNVHRTRAEILRRKFKGTARARAVFIKQSGHRPALKMGQFFEVLREQFFHAHRWVEYGQDILRGGIVKTEQIFSYHSMTSVKLLTLDVFDADAVLALDLDEPHIDVLLPGRRDVFPHEIGTDRHFSAAAVDEDEQHHPRGPAHVEDLSLIHI